jgi:hypothetical protein
MFRLKVQLMIISMVKLVVKFMIKLKFRLKVQLMIKSMVKLVVNL